MPFLVIAGEYRVVGAQPDGDSIRFYPDDPSQWDDVGGSYAVQRNASGGAQLRLDAIDALETHFAIQGGMVSQPLGLAHSARDELLRWVGFTGITRSEETVTASVPTTVRGYVLTRSADKYGRCIAFAGRGDSPAPSGGQAYVDAKLLRQSANYRLLQRGLVYPTYYRKLFPDLRAVFTTAVNQARPTRGIWPGDLTQLGLTVSSLDQVQQDAIILPKLFRRLTTYLGLSDGSTSLAGFPAYLDQQADYVYVMPDLHYTGLSTLIEVSDQTVRLTTAPELLIFEEK
ncbi:MAG TPA: hypothetical protein VE074_02570 [Jatrophihabitantaceae bacterium]|nr:hypothetical protein [Jatrophihabitantaceae bacterium]